MLILGREIKGVIFDLDGTLLDSCSIWAEVDRMFFERRNMKLPSDYADAIGHIGLDKAAEYTIERFHLNEKKEDIIQEWKSGVLNMYKSINLKGHAIEFINYLRENNIPFCAATANDEDCYKSALIHNGIYDYFDFILEVNNYKKGKEDPTIYLDACNRLGVKKEECAIFEDLLMALITSKNAGFVTVGVYEKTTLKDEMKKKEIADIYIHDYRELIK